MQAQNMNAAFLPNPFNNRKKGIKDVNKNKWKIIKILLIVAFIITCIILIASIFVKIEDIKNINLEIGDLKEDISEVQKENTDLKSTLDDEKTETKNLEKINNDLRGKNDQISKELVQLKKNGKAPDSTETISKLNEKLLNLKDSLEDHEDDLNLVKEQLVNVKKQLKKKQEKLELLESKYKSLSGEETQPIKPIIPQEDTSGEDYEFDSLMLPDKKYLQNIINIMQIRTKITTKLLYRATRDGFTSNSMHEKIDGKTNILILIGTTTGKIIGGYSSQSWGGSNVGYKSDKTARIFNLSTNRLYLINNINEAIYCDPKYFIIFGKGDLIINADGKLTANFPNSYGTGFEIKNEILEGTEQLIISEVEIYQIIPK